MVNRFDPADEIAAGPHRFCDAVKFACHRFHGVTDATLPHDEGWQFLRIGWSLETAEATTRLVDVQYHNLLDVPSGTNTPDNHQWMAVLRSVGAYEAYHRQYHSPIRPERVAEMLILDPQHPRSIRFTAGDPSSRNNSNSNYCFLAAQVTLLTPAIRLAAPPAALFRPRPHLAGIIQLTMLEVERDELVQPLLRCPYMRSERGGVPSRCCRSCSISPSGLMSRSTRSLNLPLFGSKYSLSAEVRPALISFRDCSSVLQVGQQLLTWQNHPVTPTRPSNSGRKAVNLRNLPLSCPSFHHLPSGQITGHY